MAKLTKYEKETIVLFNEGEDTASIYTYNAGLRKRLANFGKKHPDFPSIKSIKNNCKYIELKNSYTGNISYRRSESVLVFLNEVICNQRWLKRKESSICF